MEYISFDIPATENANDIGWELGPGASNKPEHGLFLKDFNPGSLVAHSGMEIGDRILSINGMSFLNISAEEASHTIATEMQIGMEIIAARLPVNLEHTNEVSILKRGSLGMRLRHSSDMHGSMVVVAQLLDNSPIKESGIQLGDAILSINGMSVEGRTDQEVSTLITNLSHGTELKFVVLPKGKKRPIVKDYFEKHTPDLPRPCLIRKGEHSEEC
eukprot:UC4_evm1s1586